MPTAEQITKFVKKVFDRYHAMDIDFFTTYDDDTKCLVECPLFPSGEIDESTLERLSLHLGMTKLEILNMDESASLRYWEKYSFFRLFHNYMDSWNWTAHYEGHKPTAEDLLINAIFTENEGYPAKRRYHYQNIRERLVTKLRELDAFIPGIFHECAEITDLSIQTEVFFSFPECAEMVSSYIDMVDRTKELFFKALHFDLDIDEANELNFLASWLQASDAVMPSINITYPNVCIFRSVYLEENFDDFYSYVKIRRYTYGSLSQMDFVPWRCKEFFDYPDLMQEFVNISPQAKSTMREFAMLVANFSCYFSWSDAEPIAFTLGTESELNDYYEMLDEKDTSPEERPKEHTHIYVEKTEAELEDWSEYIPKILRATSPATQGGLLVPQQDLEIFVGYTALKRIQKRVEAKNNRR